MRGQRLEVVGPVEPRSRVGGAAHPFDVLEMPVLGNVRRTLEHHVLEKVREPGLARAFVPRPHAVPEVDAGDRGPVIRRHHESQTVVESVLLDLYHSASSPGAPLFFLQQVQLSLRPGGRHKTGAHT